MLDFVCRYLVAIDWSAPVDECRWWPKCVGVAAGARHDESRIPQKRERERVREKTIKKKERKKEKAKKEKHSGSGLVSERRPSSNSGSISWWKFQKKKWTTTTKNRPTKGKTTNKSAEKIIFANRQQQLAERYSLKKEKKRREILSERKRERERTPVGELQRERERERERDPSWLVVTLMVNVHLAEHGVTFLAALPWLLLLQRFDVRRGPERATERQRDCQRERERDSERDGRESSSRSSGLKPWGGRGPLWPDYWTPYWGENPRRRWLSGTPPRGQWRPYLNYLPTISSPARQSSPLRYGRPIETATTTTTTTTTASIVFVVVVVVVVARRSFGTHSIIVGESKIMKRGHCAFSIKKKSASIEMRQKNINNNNSRNNSNNNIRQRGGWRMVEEWFFGQHAPSNAVNLAVVSWRHHYRHGCSLWR